jgi:hypothetical protein
MLFRFRAECLACGHEWDGLRRKIECGRVDFKRPENHQCFSCARCVFELYVPRVLSRNSWLRWVAQNVSELTRAPLQLSACALGVTVDVQTLEVIARSEILLRTCERVSRVLAGAGSRYEPASIDIGPMNCPNCGDELLAGELSAELLLCPVCEDRCATCISESQPAIVQVYYSPLDANDVRIVVRHLGELAEPPMKRLAKTLIALPAADGPGSVWDRELDG